ncbi:MAG: hypothetical protein JWP08_3240, partial [Bryobacterales bacterium]|nr:hypothetical protein [Bryobacterales bacterium]
GTYVGQFRKFQQTLHCAVFTERAMQNGKYNVYSGISARFGPQGMGLPTAVRADEVVNHLVLGAIERFPNGVGGSKGNLVLAGTASVDQGDT